MCSLTAQRHFSPTASTASVVFHLLIHSNLTAAFLNFAQLQESVWRYEYKYFLQVSVLHLSIFFFFWWLSTSILYIWTQLSTLVTVLFTFSKQAGYFSVDAFEGNSRLFLICITKFRQFCTEFRGILYTFTVHFRACTFLLLLKVESVLLFLCTTCLQIILPFFLCPHVRELSHKASD